MKDLKIRAISKTMPEEKEKKYDETALERSREWELIETRENFRALAENSPDGVMILMRDGRIEYANSMASKMCGYSHARLLALNAGQIVHPDDRQKIMDRLTKRINGLDVAPRYEALMLRSDGQSVPIEINATMTTWRGRPADMVIVRDISEPKRAEARLRESERILSTLMSNLPGMAFRCGNDPEWTMHFVSEGCLALTGYVFWELVGNRKIAYGDLIHEDDRDRIWKEVQRCLIERKPWRLEYRILTKIGHIAWVWEQGQGVYDDAGRLLHLEGFIADITERKWAEQELEKNEDRRKRAEQLAYVGELAARLNHEIKNPLATIRAGLEILDRELEMEASNRQVLVTIIREVKHVNRLVTDLLNVARSEPFNPLPMDLIPVILDTCEPFLHIARRKGIKFDIDVPESPITTIVDPRAFRRFLGNLIINATDALGGEGVIEVRAAVLDGREVHALFPDFPDGVAVLSVSDNGPGIQKDLAGRIFEPFFTTKSAGTGLGLAVAADIVESHGGKLIVKNKETGGAMFKAYLPMGDIGAMDGGAIKGNLLQKNLGRYYSGGSQR